jgi:hypothetical protein
LRSARLLRGDAEERPQGGGAAGGLLKSEQSIRVVLGFGKHEGSGVSKLKKGQRECPALGKTISSQECGSGRGSRFACTAECPHNPFTPANYEMHVGLETALIRKTHVRAASVLTGEDRERWHAAFNNRRTDHFRDLLAHSELMVQYHVKRDADGNSFAGRWLLDRWADLTNDERVLLKAMDQSRPMLLEVQRILDEQTFEGIDLLTGKTLRIVDRSAASQICRYTTFLGWWYPLPFYERLTGIVEEVNEIGSTQPLEVVQELVRHLGGPQEREEIQEWLAWNFFRVCEAADATAAAVWQRKMEQCELRITKTDYTLSDRHSLERLFQQSTAFSSAEPKAEDQAGGFDKLWLVLEPAGSGARKAEAGAGQAVEDSTDQQLTLRGRVLLGEKRLRIESMSEQDCKAVRGIVEELGGEGLRFQAELARNLAAEFAANSRPYDAALVPESLLRDSGTILVSTQVTHAGAEDAGSSQEDILQKRYGIFADEPVPALEGLTPRAAAGMPEKRALLVALMKGHIRNVDQMRRNERVDFDLNPLLKELGLMELVSTPPPLGGSRSNGPNGPGGLFDEEEELDLSVEEMAERLTRMTQKYPTHQDAETAVRKRFRGIFEALDSYFGPTVGREAEMIFKISLIRLFFLMAPEDVPIQELNKTRLLEGIDEELEVLTECIMEVNDMPSGIDEWIFESIAPGVLTDVVGVFVQNLEHLAQNRQPKYDDLVDMLAVLGAVVEELALCSPD